MNYTEALHTYIDKCNEYPDCESCPLDGGQADDNDLCYRLTRLGREFEEKKLLEPQAEYGKTTA